MRLENMRDEFPEMPQDIRMMIEEEVARQLKMKDISESPKYREETQRDQDTSDKAGRYDAAGKLRKMSPRKMTLVFLAAALAVGTTAFAGSALYKMYSEQIGNYGLSVGVQVGENGSTYGNIPKELEVVKIVNNYIPEGMVQYEGDPGKMFYESTPYQGGVSMGYVTMDKTVKSEDLMMVEKNVKSSEVLEISGHEAVYLERNPADTDNIWFDKMLYVVYPETWKILFVYGGTDISKEELLKVVENTELQPTGETYSFKDAYTWSDMIEVEQDVLPGDFKLTATAEEMKEFYDIGEEFKLQYIFDEYMGVPDYVSAKVTDVQVADNLSLLGDSPYISESWKEEIGEDGKLLENEIQYIQKGDGIDTKDEVIKTETVAQKLVYITVEYTNHSEETLENLLYNFSLAGIREVDGEYVLYSRAELDPDAEWDDVFYKGEGTLEYGTIGFYDLHGGERDNNYISSMKPGETVTVHFAQIVNEDELEYMYLNLGDFSGGIAFTSEALNQGYVDIRQ